MLENFAKLNENLEDCEEYIQKVIEGKIKNEQKLGGMINKAMSQFTEEDFSLLESMILANFKDAIIANNLVKISMA